MDISFERNILALTGTTKLEEARNKLRLVRQFVGDARCEFCNQPIQNVVLLEHTEREDLRVTSGRDCLTKLAIFNRLGVVHSVTPAKAKSIVLERKKELIDGLKEAGEKKPKIGTILSWLSAQIDLPELAREALEWLRAVGYPPTKEHSEAIITLYRERRLFPTESILNTQELALYRQYHEDCSIPRMIPLADLPRIRSILTEARAKRREEWKEVWETIHSSGLEPSLFSKLRSYAWRDPAGNALFGVKHAGYECEFALPECPDSTLALSVAPSVLRFSEVRLSTPENRRAHLVLHDETVSEWKIRIANELSRREKERRNEEARVAEEKKAEREARAKEWKEAVAALPGQIPYASFRINYDPMRVCLGRMIGTFYCGVEFRLPGHIASSFYEKTAPSAIVLSKLHFEPETYKVEATLSEETLSQWHERAKAEYEKKSAEHKRVLLRKLEDLIAEGRLIRGQFQLGKHRKTEEDQWEFFEREGSRRKYVIAREENVRLRNFRGGELLVTTVRLLAPFLSLVRLVHTRVERDGTWTAYREDRGIMIPIVSTATGADFARKKLVLVKS